MSIVVPSLVLGFKSKCVDFKSASYMVLCQIAVQSRIKEAILKQMLPILCKVGTSIMHQLLSSICSIRQGSASMEFPIPAHLATSLPGGIDVFVSGFPHTEDHQPVKKVTWNYSKSVWACAKASFVVSRHWMLHLCCWGINLLILRTFKHLCRIPALVQLLANLARQADVSGLLCAWFSQLVPAALAAGSDSSGTSSDASTSDDLAVTLPEYDQLLVAVVLDVKLEDEVAKFLSK